MRYARILAILLFTAAVIACNRSPQSSGSIRFYVGSSDMNLERGIFLCELSTGSGSFSVLDSFVSAKCPYYLDAIDDKGFLYSVDKTPWDTAAGIMAVASYRMDGETNRITLVNKQSSEGDGPCHVACSENGRFLFTANYASGTVASYPIGEDGSIGKPIQVMHGEGSGPVEGRQEGSHAHQVVLDPGNRHLLVPDLGADRIRVYTFDPENGDLAPNPWMPYLQMEPGSGPRHLVFHPGGRLLYIVNELNATVTACKYDPGTGVLTPIHSVTTVDDNHPGDKWPAAIRVDPGGRFVYASTRGEQSAVSVFRILDGEGIERIQVISGVPNWPREIHLTPSGDFLLVAGERDGTIELYRINPTSGKLKKAGSRFSLPSPACIYFIP